MTTLHKDSYAYKDEGVVDVEDLELPFVLSFLSTGEVDEPARDLRWTDKLERHFEGAPALFRPVVAFLRYPMDANSSRTTHGRDAGPEKWEEEITRCETLWA